MKLIIHGAIISQGDGFGFLIRKKEKDEKRKWNEQRLVRVLISPTRGQVCWHTYNPEQDGSQPTQALIVLQMWISPGLPKPRGYGHTSSGQLLVCRSNSALCKGPRIRWKHLLTEFKGLKQYIWLSLLFWQLQLIMEQYVSFVDRGSPMSLSLYNQCSLE